MTDPSTSVRHWLGAFEQHGAVVPHGWFPVGRAVGGLLVESGVFSPLGSLLTDPDPQRVLAGITALKKDDAAVAWMTGAILSRKPIPEATHSRRRLPNAVVTRLAEESSLEAKKDIFLNYLQYRRFPMEEVVCGQVTPNRLGALLAGEMVTPEMGGIHGWEMADFPAAASHLVFYRKDSFVPLSRGSDHVWPWEPTRYPRSAPDLEERVAGIADLSSGRLYASIGAYREAQAEQDYGAMVHGMLSTFHKSAILSVRAVMRHVIGDRTLSSLERQGILLAAFRYIQNRFSHWKFYAVRGGDDSYIFKGDSRVVIVRHRGPFAGHLLAGRIFSNRPFDVSNPDYTRLSCSHCKMERPGERACNELPRS